MLFGIAFGFCFPIMALLADMLWFKPLLFSWENIGKAHLGNPLHFIIDSAPLFLGMAFSFVGYKQAQLKQANYHLNRTFEALLQQKEDILMQNDLLIEKHREIERKSYQLSASIQYAQTIQNAILPDLKLMQIYLHELFILHKARDIVSGDFYYFNRKDGKIVVAVADCTGHGIPAAFMSLIGYQHLNNIISQQGILQPHLILECLHEGIYSTLRQTETNNSDGMDIGLCVIDPQNHLLHFAGSKISLYYIQNQTLLKLKANRTNIGGRDYRRFPFDTQTIALLPSLPTTFYLFSDGYQDQFGGPDNRKFLSTQLKDLLSVIHRLTPIEQRKVLLFTIENWINAGAKEQTDDMLILGFKA